MIDFKASIDSSLLNLWMTMTDRMIQEVTLNGNCTYRGKYILLDRPLYATISKHYMDQLENLWDLIFNKRNYSEIKIIAKVLKIYLRICVRVDEVPDVLPSKLSVELRRFPDALKHLIQENTSCLEDLGLFLTLYGTSLSFPIMLMHYDSKSESEHHFKGYVRNILLPLSDYSTTDLGGYAEIIQKIINCGRDKRVSVDKQISLLGYKILTENYFEDDSQIKFFFGRGKYPEMLGTLILVKITQLMGEQNLQYQKKRMSVSSEIVVQIFLDIIENNIIELKDRFGVYEISFYLFLIIYRVRMQNNYIIRML